MSVVENQNPGQSTNNPADGGDKTNAQKLFPDNPSENSPDKPVVESEPSKADPPKEAPAPEVKGEPAKAPEVKTETPEYKIPDVLKEHKGIVDEVLKFAADNKLSKEQAQVLLDREANIAQETSKAQIAQFEKQKNDWADQTKNDALIGGEKLEENLKLANQSFSKAPKFVQDYLQKSGLANQVDVIKWFVEMAKSAAPDKLVPSGQEAHAENKPIANRLYANHK